MDGDERRARLGRARLYFVTEAIDSDRVEAALHGGVDVLQLRDRSLAPARLREAAAVMRDLAHEHGALFLVNDDPGLAVAVDADGVHVGQDDMPVAQARAIVGPDRLIGLSTHEPSQLDAAAGADYLSVGPVSQTPTKPGRPATGLDYVRYAATHDPGVPWFAIGGIDTGNLRDVVLAGARRVVVVRAIRDADDPAGAARELEAGVGAT